MGNSNCNLLICLDRTNYATGETCAGKVCVSVNQDFVKCHSLWLRLKGYEDTKFRKDIEDKRSKILLIHQDHILYTCLPSMVHGQGTGLHRGQYDFPFEFVIPRNLPSNHCQIRYELSACMQIHRTKAINLSPPFQRQEYRSQDLQLMIRGYNSLRRMKCDNSPSHVSFPTKTLRCTNGASDCIPLSPNGTNSDNHDGDSMRKNAFKFIVPNHALDAFCGTNMTVSHFLRVKIIPTVCCMMSPESFLNVQIAHVSIPPATKGYGGVNITSIEMTPPPFAPSYEASESGGPNHVSLPPDWSP